MKKVPLLLALSVLALCSFSTLKKIETVVIHTTIYCDHCKVCDSCQPNIIRTVEAVPGVRAAELNVEEQTITVHFNPDKTTADTIRQAITKAGYDADEMKADPTGYNNLEGCCKKPEDR